MHWNTILLDQHANVHASELTRSGTVFSYQDMVCGGLADEQLRLRPAEGQNSLVWLIWHMTRCEDVALNVAIAGQAQVLDNEWRRQLRICRGDIGTGMTRAEVAELSEWVDVEALRSYRLAVGRQSRDILGGLDAATLGKPLKGEQEWATTMLGEHAGWVGELWSSWRRQDFLYMAIGHCYHHWGEAITVRSLSGLGVGL